MKQFFDVGSGCNSHPAIHRAVAASLSAALVLSINADDTWEGDTDASWATASNWVGGTVPGAADTATFSSGSPSNTTIDLGAGVTIQGLSFGAGPGITLGTGAVNSQTLTRSTGGNFFANSTTDHTINAQVILGEPGDASGSFVFQNQGTTNLLTIAGDILNNGNAQTLNKQGPGTLILSGDNSYGNTIIDNGTLRLGSATALGTGNTITVRSSNLATGVTSDTTLDLAGNSISVGALILGNTTTGTFGPGQTPKVVDTVGGGVITLTNASAVTYNSGSAGNLNGTGLIDTDLTWGSNKSFTVGDGEAEFDLEISGSIIDFGGSSPNALIKNGAGKLLLSGADNTANNTILVRNGTVAFSTDSQLSSGDVVLGFNAVSAALEYVGSGGTTNNRIDIGRASATNATYTGGAIVLSSGTGAIEFTNVIFNDPIAQVTSITRDLTFGGANVDDNTVSGVIADNDAGGVINVIKQDAGKWILNGNNTYSGTTSLNEGRLDVGGTNTGIGEFSVASSAILGGEGSIAGDLTFGAGGILAVDGSNGTTAFGTSGTIDTSAGVSVLIENAPSGTGTFTVVNYGSVGSSTVGDFSINAAGVQASARGETFTDTGTSFTLDLGFADLTWDNGSGDGFWNVNDSTNWDNGVPGQVFFDGDFVTFGDTGAGTVTLAESVVAGSALFENDTTAYIINDNGGGETLTVNDSVIFRGNADATVNAVIAGAGSLTLGDENDGISDGANLTLTGANTFSGGVNITEGQLRITHSEALGTGAVSITDDGANSNREPSLELDAAGLVVANDVTITNDGFFKRIRYDVSGSGTTSELAGTLTLEETLDRLVGIQAGAGETLHVSGQVTGGGVFVVNGSSGGVVRLTNETSDHTGVVLIRQNGTLEISSIADAGVVSSVGAGSSVTLGYRNENGTLRYVGDGDSTNRQIRIGEDFSGSNRTGGGTIEANGSGALVFTNAVFNEAEVGTWVGARTLTLAGSNTDANEIQGAIVDNNDTSSDVSVSIVKDGTGKWTLSGDSTYTGTTAVNDGTLIVDGSLSAASAVSVSGGTLGGSGTIGGNATFSGGTLTGGADGATGTLDFSGDLTMNSGSAWLVDLAHNLTAGSGGSVDLINVSGALSLGSTDLIVNESGSFLRGEVYQIASYGVSPSLGMFSDNAIVVGSAGGQFEINYADGGNFITLTAVPEPSGFLILLPLLLVGVIVLRSRRKRAIIRAH